MAGPETETSMEQTLTNHEDRIAELERIAAQLKTPVEQAPAAKIPEAFAALVKKDRDDSLGVRASTTFGNLDVGAGPSVTIAVGPSGFLIVGWSASLRGEVVNAFPQMSIEIPGIVDPNAGSEGTTRCIRNDEVRYIACGITTVFLSVEPGEYTITAKYATRGSAYTGRFIYRELWAYTPGSEAA